VSLCVFHCATSLNNLRYFGNLYFHSSVGGTNPSLLEAMASKALIMAHNSLNKAILKQVISTNSKVERTTFKKLKGRLLKTDSK
jgi:hypothetical protein